MVEGHSVHRVAALHRKRLVGNTFKAWSPNGRFAAGAQAIDGKPFTRIEAVGKNLFAFFGSEADLVVVHIHFGMAGAWAVFPADQAPEEPSNTNRLRLESKKWVADLSAMTVQHGDIDLYTSKRSKLGQDPLRNDANPEKLWYKVQNASKSIGALIMDQSYFTGPGNIYRAEILFKAGVHPDIRGSELSRGDFDRIWHHTVQLLRRGYETGSILTVDPEEAKDLGQPKLRRYIYNCRKCPRCQTSIQTWQIASRTCYACPTCQPRKGAAVAVVTPVKECEPFNSHCAPESEEQRLKTSGPWRLTVKELREELLRRGIEIPSKASKAMLVDLLEARDSKFVSPEDAAAEKAAAGENLAVEHIAELAPSQARTARARVDWSVSLGKQTVAQLKQELIKRTVEVPAKATKAMLLELLQNERPHGVTPAMVESMTYEKPKAAARDGRTRSRARKEHPTMTITPKKRTRGAS